MSGAQKTSPATPPVRRKSSNVRSTKARRDLQATIAQIDTLLPALADKPSKQADILCEKASAIKTLITLEAEERETEQEIRIKELEAGHEADSCRIAELEQQNRGLQVAASMREVVTVSDPNHAAVKEERDALESIVTLFAGVLTEDIKAETAVRVTSCSPRAVKSFCRLAHIDYGALLRYTTLAEPELRRLQTARDSNGVIVRAVLAVKYPAPAKLQEPAVLIPDTRSGDEKLRDAKASVRCGL